MSKEIRRVAVVGSGLIGASWAALFAANGLEVTATDVAPEAEERLRAAVAGAWPALESLGVAAGATPDRVRFATSLEAAVEGADLVQENGPERIEFKHDVFRRLDALLPATTILSTSTSGLKMSDIQTACARHPERCVIAHPFNPPHLVPLVEIVGGKATSAETIDLTRAFFDSLGKHTIHIRKEVPGHVANRLQAAVFRELVHLVSEDVVSVADADAAVAWGRGCAGASWGRRCCSTSAAGPAGWRRSCASSPGR